jgi:hypothetical protein
MFGVTDLQNSAQNELRASLYGVERTDCGEQIALECFRLCLPLIRIPYIGPLKTRLFELLPTLQSTLKSFPLSH